MNYQELLDQAELNGFVEAPTPPKYERVKLYSIAAFKAAFPNSVFLGEFNFILEGEEFNVGITNAEDLEAALPPMGV